MNETLIHLGAISAILELIFWAGVLFYIYRYNKGDSNVQ